MKRLMILLALIIFFAASCNMPQGEAGQNLSMTHAAETLTALTSATPFGGFGLPTTTTTPVGLPTLTPFPTLQPVTNTPLATATSNCNIAQFVTDVTIPDGTIMAPNQPFVKTWRFRNAGTCTWTPSYAVVFSTGNSMNGPATQALTGNVNPGQTVDISVNLTAPASPADYTGHWRFRDGAGVLFNQFYVQIKVQTPATATNTLPPAIAQVVLNSLGGEDGYVTSGGTVFAFPNVGDTADEQGAEAFVNFDMSVIPAGATITKVVVNFSDYDMLGNPWGLADGCLRAYSQNYGTVDAGDYVGGSPTGAYIRWCGAGELSSTFEVPDMKTLVQSAVGSSRLSLRLQFKAPNPNGNGIGDMVRFGTVKLTVTYQ